jgi:hypothetical protein
MRFALQLFTTFLTSGATDVGKMLWIAERSGTYNVPYHEFVKSIMLGDRAYYKEEASPILNIFNVSSHRNASHFNAHRIIRVLLAHRGETTSVGRGFVNLERLIAEFENVFDNREAFVWTLDRMVRFRLVETSSRSSESVEGASHVRITSAGWYYLRFLSKAFAYLDLVLQDTPVDDHAVHVELRQSVRDVDNMADKDELKLARIRTRFARVEAFLAYMQDEEDYERRVFSLDKVQGAIGHPIVAEIIAQYQREKEWIELRLAENREHVEEPAPFEDIEHAEQDVLKEFIDSEENNDDDEIS